MCLSVHPTEFGIRKCLQKQQGGKWGLKNRMPAWHRQVSVSAALPTTGSALSDKYKHSRPGPAFLSLRQQQQQQQRQQHGAHCWRDSVPGIRCWRETLLLRHGNRVIVSERLFVNCPCSNTSLLSGNIHKAITPSLLTLFTDTMTDALLANADTWTC